MMNKMYYITVGIMLGVLTCMCILTYYPITETELTCEKCNSKAWWFKAIKQKGKQVTTKWNNRYKYIMEKQSPGRQEKIRKELLKHGLDPGKCSWKHEFVIYAYIEEVI